MIDRMRLDKKTKILLVIVISSIGFSGFLGNTLSTTTRSLTLLKEENENTRSALHSLNVSFIELTGEYDALNSSFRNLTGEYETLFLEHEHLTATYGDLQQQYDEMYQARYEKGFTQGITLGNRTGYMKGLADGAGRGYTIRDPTYEEMKAFLRSDRTNARNYVGGYYRCWNFAADVKNNSFAAGYRCGLVYLELYYNGEYCGHAVVCFNTIDKGLVFVEPQTDEIVHLEVGGRYLDNYHITYLAIVW